MKRKLRFLQIGLTVLLFANFSGTVLGKDPSEPQETQKFIRLVQDDRDQPLGLQTSIVRYQRAPAASPTVDLIGAVHVADKSYYLRLNEIFQRYDAVLYELVAPQDHNVPHPDQQTDNPLTAMQRGVKGLLELEYQLDWIDYTQPNLVHADLSPQEFARSMQERGESLVQMFFRSLGLGVALQSKAPEETSDLHLLAALLSQNRALQLKRVMARQFDVFLSATNPFDPPEGSTIVTVRNRRAMDVLQRQMREGKKRIAVFYGAAHMEDMERQLLDRFQLRPVEEHWLTAWDLTGSDAAGE